MLGLYIHIPFCKNICSYCDFPKQVAKKDTQKAYMNKLICEIDEKKDILNDIVSVYIGGGTPNSIELELLEKLFIKIKPYLDNSKENSIELNPELVTKDLCLLLKKYNINRVSLGVQTINERLLKLLNRHHNKEMIIDAINNLKAVGINNINTDFIFGIPTQSMEDLNSDIEFIKTLPITHISYYSLILEEKTVFSHMLNHGQISLLDDDLVADMYEKICQILNLNEFKHYEISNFAKVGYESIHNKLYWEVKEYVGVGSGASSYIEGKRITNPLSVKGYLENKDKDISIIDIEESKREFFMLGFRLVDGVSLKEYKSRFNSNPYDDFNIDKLLKNKLVEVNNDNIKVCYDKLFIANLVFEEFVK